MAQKQPKKVLITGANGFIGNQLMQYYKAQGIAAVGVDLCGNGDDIIEGDIAEPETMSALVARVLVIVGLVLLGKLLIANV